MNTATETSPQVTAIDPELQAVRDKLDAMGPAERDAFKVKLRAAWAATDNLKAAKANLAKVEASRDHQRDLWNSVCRAVTQQIDDAEALATMESEAGRHLQQLRDALCRAGVDDTKAVLRNSELLAELAGKVRATADADMRQAEQAVADAEAAVAAAERRAEVT